MVPGLRKEGTLKSIKKRDISYIKDLVTELNTSPPTVCRDVAALEQEGGVIIMYGGAAKYKAEDFDKPMVRKKLIHSKEKEITARKAAALVEGEDCVYVGSGMTTVGVLRYLQGRRITIVSGSTKLLDNPPVKNTRCILLGGEVRGDSKSILGALMEEVMFDVYFDKAFVGVDEYIPDGGIHIYNDRGARKEVIVKDHSKAAYILMDTSEGDKYTSSRIFDLGGAVPITGEEDLEDSQVQIHGYRDSDTEKVPTQG